MATKPPLSPWAQRYGLFYEIDSTLGQDGVQHSGYHTGHPRLDPKFFAEPISKPEIDNCAQFSHPNDIHKFFHIEHKQYGAFKGIKPWQHGSLMQYVRFSDRGLLPGGHWRPEVRYPEVIRPYRQARHEDMADISRLLDDDMIPVDENKWFPFLRRDRWYDLFGRQQVTSGKRWSIDQPKLWGKLSVSLELVNRILRIETDDLFGVLSVADTNTTKVLKALINDKHPALHTMLFGTLMMWRDTRAMQPFPEPFPNAKVLLSYNLYKSYCDLNDLDCPMEYLAHLSTEDWEGVLTDLLRDQTWGFSDNPEDLGTHMPAYGTIITLGVTMIDSLSKNDITLAERCHLQYYLARTILHEMMHSLATSRMRHTFPADPNVPDDYIEPEPFVDFDGIAELGYAMEQRIFGGVVVTLHGTGEYPFGLHHRSWPSLLQVDGDSDYGYKIGNHPIFSTVQDVTVCPLPAIYTSKQLSKSFWEDENIPRKSDNFFHFNQLLVGRTQFLPDNPLRWQEMTVDRGKIARGEVDPGETEMMVSTGQTNLAEFADIWESISEFATEFHNGNEIRCGQISLWFARTVPWSAGADLYRAALIPISVQSVQWIVHCIGLLMMAATPIRRFPIIQEEIETEAVLQLQPSARAPTLPPINIIPDFSVNHKSCIESELFDPINTGNEPVPVFDHINILNVLRSALQVVIDAKVRVSKPWVLEIMDPDFHHGLWAPDWDFKIPDYAPDQLAIWDEAQQVWVSPQA
ncbi:hypothetical protein FHL15_000616 [Xylaria flabelliformis]|uniref:Uncharacterized protein n=1 Tax=Xylaria flabelliformis TaxID=2512241 RepID=A0A553IEA1_9PEZI|nr:hypothetical protein FHL15_000616 [Xylaria flabelliformis]